MKASLMTHNVKAKLCMPSVVDWKAVKKAIVVNIPHCIIGQLSTSSHLFIKKAHFISICSDVIFYTWKIRIRKIPKNFSLSFFCHIRQK